MPGRLSIAKQGLTIVVLLLAVELFFVGAIAVLLQDARAQLAKERHVVAVISGSSQIANLTQRLSVALAFSAFPSRLKDMIGEKHDAEKYRNELVVEFDKLKKLAADDPEALRLIEEQEQMLNAAAAQYVRDIDVYMAKERLEKEGFESKLLKISNNVTEKYENFIARYKSIEESSPKRVADSIAQLKIVMILAAVLNLLAGLLLAYFFVKRVSSRIDRLAGNMTGFQKGEPLPELPVDADGDEINHLEIQFKQMVDSLAQAARNEEALVQGAYDVICTMDANGIFTEVNSACLRQWGYLREEIIGRYFDLVVAKDDVANVNKHLERLKDKSGFISFETGIDRIDSERIEASWSCYWSSESKSIFCFIRDVSELNSMETMLKAREEQVRSMMANIPVGMLVVDENGLVKSANHKVEALIGCGSNGVLERSLESILERPEDGSRRATLKNADGECIPAEVTVTPLNSVAGVENLVVVDDVREQVRFENMKRDFVALLRENLRTPLIKVRELIDTESGATDDRHSLRVERITMNADRLLRLIDELLTIETLAPGKLVGELKPVPVAAILLQSMNSLSDYAAKQGVSLRVESLEAEVVGDRERLLQVVINLLSNAIKFSPQNAEVILAAETNDGMIEISITDSGKGIPADLSEAIFKPYMQASSGDSLKGTGLGLPICKAIIDSHNGSIGVRNVPSGGSRFWFRIPRVE